MRNTLAGLVICLLAASCSTASKPLQSKHQITTDKVIMMTTNDLEDNAEKWDEEYGKNIDAWEKDYDLAIAKKAMEEQEDKISELTKIVTKQKKDIKRLARKLKRSKKNQKSNSLAKNTKKKSAAPSKKSYQRSYPPTPTSSYRPTYNYVDIRNQTTRALDDAEFYSHMAADRLERTIRSRRSRR